MQVTSHSFDFSTQTFPGSEFSHVQPTSTEQIRVMVGDVLDHLNVDNLGDFADWDDFTSLHHPELHDLYTGMGYHSALGLGYRLDLEAGFDLTRDVIIDRVAEVLSTPLVNNAEHFQLGLSSSIPETIEPSAEYVTLTFDNGNKFSFDGEQAGMVANEFATIYNSSALFRETMHGLASEQDGLYAFHSYVNDHEFDILGSNITGTADVTAERSGLFLNVSDDTLDLDIHDIKTTILHEITHDLHEENLEHAHGLDHLHHAGSSHSREQMIYVGAILNEMAHNGHPLNFNVNDDYSQNIQFFPTLDPINPWTGARAEDSLKEAAKQHEVFPEDIRAWEQAVISYHQIADNIFNLSEGSDIEAAVDAFLAIPEEQTLTMGITDVNRTTIDEHGKLIPTSFATYDLRQLILDELVFAYDSNDWLGTEKSGKIVRLEKQAMGEFLNELSSRSEVRSDVLIELAERLQIDLTTEFPEFVA